jgi:hypothetical protein
MFRPRGRTGERAGQLDGAAREADVLVLLDLDALRDAGGGTFAVPRQGR